MPPIRHAARRLAILAAVAIGAIVLLGGGYFLYMRFAAQHDVLVDNGNDFPVEVELGGEKISLAPKTSRVVPAGNGKLTVKATGPNGFSETASIELPEASWKAKGRTAVYNVGGKSSLAVVTVTYGHVAGAPKPVVMIPREPRLALLPPGSYGAIDGAFPEEITASRRQMGAMIQHVCHIDVEARKLGCGGLDGFFD